MSLHMLECLDSATHDLRLLRRLDRPAITASTLPDLIGAQNSPLSSLVSFSNTNKAVMKAFYSINVKWLMDHIYIFAAC